MRAKWQIFVGILIVLPWNGWVAAQESPRPDSGRYLLQTCGSALPEASSADFEAILAGIQCVGFIDGMMEMNSLYQGVFLDIILDRDDIGPFCLPEAGIEIQHAIRIVLSYLELHPDRLEQPRRLAVSSALAEVFPCVGNQDIRP